MVLPGPVAEVDRAGHRVRIRIGGDNDRPLLSPWVRYGQIAGALKVHTPPTIGQQMHLFSPSGDPRLGIALPLGWSNSAPAPDNGDHPVVTFGQVRVDVTEDGLTITVGETVVSLTPDAMTVERGGTLFRIDDEILAKASKITTDGPTHLNKGTREVVFKGSADTAGYLNNTGASGVFV
jgi:phage baseplate assembly protein V